MHPAHQMLLGLKTKKTFQIIYAYLLKAGHPNECPVEDFLQLLMLPILLALGVSPNIYQILVLKLIKLCRKYSNLSLVNGKSV